jgi:ketol-acid reductoisomerase
MNSNKLAVTLIGFGSQAKAWALNLRDSGANVTVALNPQSPSIAKAQSMGFKTIELQTDALKQSSLLVLLIPDDRQADFLEKNQSYINKGSHLIYAHGFSLSKQKLADFYPQFHHSLLAPKAIASEVRYQYEIKGKIGAATFAPIKEQQKEIELLASLAGFTALYPSSPEEECKADLFSEQSLLCSILPYVALESFNILRKNGVSKEVAFMECFLELKSISQALVTIGPEDFFKMISPNALIGSQKGRKELVGSHFKKSLEQLYTDIENGTFFKEVETDADKIRKEVLEEWKKEELTSVFKSLKEDLIN